MPCTTPLRALFDDMRRAPDERESTVAMDTMAAAELVSIRQMRSYVEGRSGWRGVPQVRRALDLADENGMSPNETRMRLVWVLDAGLPNPLVNQPVFDLRGKLSALPTSWTQWRAWSGSTTERLIVAPVDTVATS